LTRYYNTNIIVEKGGLIMLNKMVEQIRDAKTDKDIKEILCDVYITTQIDSKVREQFDTYIKENSN